MYTADSKGLALCSDITEMSDAELFEYFTQLWLFTQQEKPENSCTDKQTADIQAENTAAALRY